MEESKTMTLDTGDHFTLNIKNPDSTFDGVNLYLKNNSNNLVKVSTDGTSILISVEKRSK